MSDFRRMLMFILLREKEEGDEDMQPYKTVTLQENHTSDSIGNPVYWADFLSLPLLSDVSDKNFYIVVFNNNTATMGYRADIILYYNSGTSVKAMGIRNNRTVSHSVAYSTNLSYYASSGTTIDVYALPNE